MATTRVGWMVTTTRRVVPIHLAEPHAAVLASERLGEGIVGVVGELGVPADLEVAHGILRVEDEQVHAGLRRRFFVFYRASRSS
jgi:hypothetical protein